MKTLGLEDAAKFLHVSEYSLRKMAENGIVPGAKVGPVKGYRWVFTDEALEEYLRTEIRKQTARRRGEQECQEKQPAAAATARRRTPKTPPPLHPL